MLIKILIFFISAFAGSVYSQERDCFCSQKYSLTTSTSIKDLGFDWPPIEADDQRDTCDYKCARKCDENVRELIGGNSQTVTTIGLEKICKDVASDRSVIKDGIVLWSYYDLEFCVNGRNRLEENICCVYCNCKLVYYKSEEKIPLVNGGLDENLIIDKDLSQTVLEAFNEGRRAFKCNQIEHDRTCETICRREISQLIEYQQVHERLDENR